MRHTAEIFLWGTRIGIVSQDESERVASFEYDARFLRSGIELSPLVMPLSSRVFRFPSLYDTSFYGLPGLLADSLPDKFGNAVIDAWLSSQGRSVESFSAIERLCYTGVRGMGALEYIPAEGPKANALEKINVERLVTLASEVLTERTSQSLDVSDQDFKSLLKFGTSAGGARAKAIIAWNPETQEIRSGQIEAGSGFEYWIMKLSGVANNKDKEEADADDYSLIEYAYYLMAQEAGIQMSECRLFSEGGRNHFMTKRFDREPTTGRKIHMQTLSALSHSDYQNAGQYSYEQAAQLCLRLGLPQNELDQLFMRMVFNVLASNCDDHVKNISFLMDRRGVWRLSPAYDVMFAYNPKGAWTSSHQMTINGKRSNVSQADMLEAGSAMNITQRRARAMIAKVREAVGKWSDYAHQTGIREQRIAAVQECFPRIENQ